MNGEGRTSVVYLHSHDSGRYVQPYGHPVPTPNLQRLAEDAVLFRQAFSGAPTCSPSRASLFTGQWPHCAGMLGLAHLGFSMPTQETNLVQTLRRAGYRTTLAGVQHIADRPELVGYDEVLPSAMGTAADVGSAGIGDAAAAFLQGHPVEPFFLDVGFFDTHRPYDPADAADDPRWCAPPAPLPDTPATRADFAAYRSSARRLDDGMGRVLDALEKTGLSERCLVVVTTDHGIPFPHMKCNLTDHGIGVMLLVRGPGGFRGGLVVDASVSQLDIFPTICEVAGLAIPSHVQGTSLVPLIEGRVENLHEAIFAEINYHADYEPQRCVRTDRWKYIRRFGELRRVASNCDPGPSRTLLGDAGWDEQDVEEELLFDLVFDPQERRNLASSEKYRAALDALRGRLRAWQEATNDPLLQGSIPLPAGARTVTT